MFPALLLAAVMHRDPVLVCAVVAEAEKHGLDPYVVCALVEVESGFNPRAKGKGGDYGLFQIHPRWHGTGYTRVGDNVAKGVSIIRDELDRCYGEIDKALGRYNAGSNRRIGARYARKVLTLAARLRKEVGGKSWRQSYWQCFRAWSFCWWPVKLNEWCVIGGKRRRVKCAG